MRLNEFEQYVSDLVTIPSNFMLKHEAAVVLIKAHETEETFKLCKSLIEDFEPGCGLWKSDSFWANELNDYNYNIVGSMLLAETCCSTNSDIVLEALNKYIYITQYCVDIFILIIFFQLRSFNCLYAKITNDYVTKTNTSNYNENIKTLRRILIGKILLLRATIFSKLNREEECEAAFIKALTYNSG